MLHLRSILSFHPNAATSSSCVFAFAQCRRPFNASASLQHGIYPFFNKHKTVTDPKRQDPDYFEKLAEKLPLDSRYIDELKRIWEEKIGSERELIFKAPDRLIGVRNVKSSEEFGLPKLDMSRPRLDWTGIDALEGAPPEVKKIYSLEHGSSGDIGAAWKLEMMKKVRWDELDAKSLPAKIAWATTLIRKWSQEYARNEVARKRLKYGRMRRRATWISHPLNLLINHRRKLLRLLRQSSEQEFQRVITELKIAYHVEKEPEHVKTRKAWSEAQLKRRVALEKERRLSELHKKLMEGREAKTKQIDEEMASMAEEERQILARLHQLDIVEGKTVANVVGKYVPDYVGELKEIAQNGRLFF